MMNEGIKASYSSFPASSSNDNFFRPVPEVRPTPNLTKCLAATLRGRLSHACLTQRPSFRFSGSWISLFEECLCISVYVSLSSFYFFFLFSNFFFLSLACTFIYPRVVHVRWSSLLATSLEGICRQRLIQKFFYYR